MPLAPRPLPFDPRALAGLSERFVTSHHANNYGGAVRRLAAIRAQLAAGDVAALPAYALNGLKREELIAANSVHLHEIHFAGLGGTGELPDGPLQVALAAQFGSVERWRNEFIALGKALAGGSGWVLLSWLPCEARLANQWAADHAHAFAEAVPIIALDMYEHAYHLDFGADAAAWIDAFMRNLAWQRIAQRFEAAVAASTFEFGVEPRALAAGAEGVLILDVRRAAAARASPSRVRGAQWRDPERVDAWAAELRADRPIAAYCVHGHAISRTVAARLRYAGREARHVDGGFERWSAQHLPLEPNAGGAA